jgi:hypothetical protein
MLNYIALETDMVRDWRSGGADAHGQPPERGISNASGNPCRHCLKDIPAGRPMLVLALKPFAGMHPYAETGSIFVCVDSCTRVGGQTVPPILTTSPDYLLKGYSGDQRIVYGTGAIVAAEAVPDRAQAIFADPEVASIHVRSARNNCYQLRIDRG